MRGATHLQTELPLNISSDMDTYPVHNCFYATKHRLGVHKCLQPHRPLAIAQRNRDIVVMRNIISILIGLFALILVIPAFIPLLGWANWIIIPIAVVGLAIGAMSDRTSGRNLNIVVIAVGVGRLLLGGGLI